MNDSARTLLNRAGLFRPGSIHDADRPARQASALIPDPARICTVRLESWESLPDLEAAWTTLLDRCPGHSVFQTFAWHACWWEAFCGLDELFVILGYAGSELVGVAPMMITREKGPLGGVRKHVRFIGSSNHASDYCDFMIDPEHPQVLDALLEEMNVGAKGFDRLDLSHFPSHSPNKARILEYFEGRGARVSVEFEADAPVRILGDSQADLKAAGKSSLKRHTRFFEKSGDLRFRQCESEEEILGFLDGFFSQHKSRRAQTDAPSQFLDPAQQAFYRELVRALFHHGWLRFDVVLFNGAPLAFHFGFQYQRRFLWYKPTFDVQFACKSPGEVLIKFLLEDAIGRGLEEFDFTVGSEPFKYRFANRIRTNDRIIAFRSTGDYGIHRAIFAGKSILKKIRKRNLASMGNAVRT